MSGSITKESVEETRNLMRAQRLFPPKPIIFVLPDVVYSFAEKEAEAENRTLDEWARRVYGYPVKLTLMEKL